MIGNEVCLEVYFYLCRESFVDSQMITDQTKQIMEKMKLSEWDLE